ncbi:hypothetical protein HY090_02140 [Candidatus Kaiserbacteria bacterium]|nr:hypothetical protein [Candidatus Kaiserbacteria bacterium]
MNLITRIIKKAGRMLRGEKMAPLQQVAPERIRSIAGLAALPLSDDKKTRRVEIVMLKFKEDPEVIGKAVSNILQFTEHPFKLTIFDNRLNTANMSKIWNKLVRESSCEYICIIDSDAFVPDVSPSWLSRMMESIDETGVVAPLTDNIGGVTQASHAKPYPSFRLERGVWAGVCMLFKKSVWEEINYDERFNLYGQDIAWAYAVGQKKGGAVIRSDVLLHHIHGHSGKKAEAEGTLDRLADKRHGGDLLKKMMGGEG